MTTHLCPVLQHGLEEDIIRSEFILPCFTDVALDLIPHICCDDHVLQRLVPTQLSEKSEIFAGSTSNPMISDSVHIDNAA